MYGSTDMNRLRTRTCPSESSGRAVSVRVKLAGVGQPEGREARTIWRGTRSSADGNNRREPLRGLTVPAQSGGTRMWCQCDAGHLPVETGPWGRSLGGPEGGEPPGSPPSNAVKPRVHHVAFSSWAGGSGPEGTSRGDE